MTRPTQPPLTAKRIEALLGRDKEYGVSDGGAPGLQLCVTAAGGKVFRWFVHDNGAQRKVTIGRWSREPEAGCVTLAEARMWLTRLKVAHREGRLDSALSVLRAGKPLSSPARLSVSAIAAQFLEYIALRRRRPEQVHRPIDFDILPAIGKRPIISVTTRECCAIVEAVVARGSRAQAGVVLTALRQLFNFAGARGLLTNDPTTPLRDPEALGVVRNMSQRVLSTHELIAFWGALDADHRMTSTVRDGLKLLLLLGVRSGELLRARWEELDLRGDQPTWTIPVTHQKLTKR